MNKGAQEAGVMKKPLILCREDLHHALDMAKEGRLIVLHGRGSEAVGTDFYVKESFYYVQPEKESVCGQTYTLSGDYNVFRADDDPCYEQGGFWKPPQAMKEEDSRLTLRVVATHQHVTRCGDHENFAVCKAEMKLRR